LAVSDLSGLGELMADPAREIVFHDADYDLRLFDRHYGFHAARIFDTRVAAELLGEPALSLAALLEKYLGVKVDKRFQRADWSARPLSEAMLAYAATDTAHLVALRDLLGKALEQLGRAGWAEEEFQLLTGVRWSDNGPDREPGWLRIKGVRALTPRQLAVLREVHSWRRALAARLDRAEFRILGNEALLAIATSAPTTREALAAIKGIGRETLERRSKAILAAVKRGLRVPEKDLPVFPRPPRRLPEPEVESRLGRLKRARTTVAARLGLAPGVVCPNSVLEAIARADPDSIEALRAVPGMRRWQVETCGEELLAALARSP
jgi:ribonuclease D